MRFGRVHIAIHFCNGLARQLSGRVPSAMNAYEWRGLAYHKLAILSACVGGNVNHCSAVIKSNALADEVKDKPRMLLQPCLHLFCLVRYAPAQDECWVIWGERLLIKYSKIG